jgi:hypothetical protein
LGFAFLEIVFAAVLNSPSIYWKLISSQPFNHHMIASDISNTTTKQWSLGYKWNIKVQTPLCTLRCHLKSCDHWLVVVRVHRCLYFNMSLAIVFVMSDWLWFMKFYKNLSGYWPFESLLYDQVVTCLLVSVSDWVVFLVSCLTKWSIWFCHCNCPFWQCGQIYVLLSMSLCLGSLDPSQGLSSCWYWRWSSWVEFTVESKQKHWEQLCPNQLILLVKSIFCPLHRSLELK